MTMDDGETTQPATPIPQLEINPPSNTSQSFLHKAIHHFQSISLAASSTESFLTTHQNRHVGNERRKSCHKMCGGFPKIPQSAEANWKRSGSSFQLAKT